MLEVICETTGLGFAFVARVTKQQWVACAVKDDINFGLLPGSELALKTTICHEIENHHEAVVINQASIDLTYCNHPTPEQYGFESYISVPIILTDESFFGTLCALDPKPAILNTPKITGMLLLFADLIKLFSSPWIIPFNTHSIMLILLKMSISLILGHYLCFNR